MSSQEEEYLDNLLQTIANKEELSEGTSIDDILDFDAIQDIDDADIIDDAGVAAEAGISDDLGNIDLEGMLNDLGNVEEAGISDDLGTSADAGILDDLGNIDLAGMLNDLENVEEAGISDDLESSADAGILDDLGNIDLTGMLNDVENAEEAGISDDLESSADAGILDDLGNIDLAGMLNDLGNVEEAGISNDLESSADARISDELGTSADAGILDDLGNVDVAGMLDDVASMEAVENTEDEEDTEDISGMTLEDIDSILEQNQHLEEEMPDSRYSTDLDALLSGESELESIHDLLDKAEKDELIDESLLLDQNETSSTEIEDLLSEMENPSADVEKGKKATNADKEEKKRLKEEKKAQKQAERLAAKQEKEAKKAAKKAAKEAEKAEKSGKKALLSKQNTVPATSEAVAQNEDESEDIFKFEKEDISELLIKDDEEMADVDSLFSDIEAMGIMDENNGELEQELSGLKEKTDSVDELSKLLDGDAEPFGQENEDSQMAFELISEEDELSSISEKKPAKKKGLWAKILDFLMEEDEENDEREIILSEENESILRELDRSKDKGKKKGKKGKKGKDVDETEDFEEGSEDKKSKKEKKKPKKEKKPKLKAVEEPEKKLSKRRVSLIFLICLSFGAALLVLVKVCNDYSDKQVAKVAYDEGDYKTCYQNLTGKYLNESEKIMYGKSESILRIKLWIREYELFIEEGNNEYALDSLIQAVHDYPTLYDYSTQWNAVSEVSVVYNEILSILLSKYNLTEEQAKAIAAEPNDIEYSRMIYTILDGGTFGSWDKEWKPEPEPEKPLDDMLPEETDIKNNNFIDMNS